MNGDEVKGNGGKRGGAAGTLAKMAVFGGFGGVAAILTFVLIFGTKIGEGLHAKSEHSKAQALTDARQDAALERTTRDLAGLTILVETHVRSAEAARASIGTDIAVVRTRVEGLDLLIRQMYAERHNGSVPR